MNVIPWSQGECFYSYLGEGYGHAPESFALAYTPAMGRAVVVDAATLSALLAEAPEAAALRDMLFPPAGVPAPADPPVEKRVEFLPTLACNFRCTYCYAAQSHDRRKLTPRQYSAVLEAWMAENDAPETQYKVSFVGGGEPLLEWPDVLACMDEASRRAEALGRTVRFSIITNGSLCSPAMCEGLLKHRVNVRVSFEILPDIQQKQRGSYEKVAAGITTMCASGVRVGIRSIITEDNVHRQAEMVRTAARLFPAVKDIDFEPVCTDGMDPAGMESFLNSFGSAFWEAYDEAYAHGIHLDCIALRMAQGRSATYCPGDFCISPSGSVSACHRSILPQDCGGDVFIYGSVNEDGGVGLTPGALDRIQAMKAARNHEECQGCFAKWNCSGGCLYQRLLLTPGQFQAQCRFTRAFLLDYLLRRQDETCRRQFGRPLKQVLCEGSGNQP